MKYALFLWPVIASASQHVTIEADRRKPTTATEVVQLRRT